MVPGHHMHILHASILRQTSAFYVKKVVNDSFLQQLGLASNREGGVNLKLKFGIKKACLISMICDSTTDVMLKRKSSPVTAGTQVDECTTSSRLGQEAGHLRGHSSIFLGGINKHLYQTPRVFGATELKVPCSLWIVCGTSKSGVGTDHLETNFLEFSCPTL